jgi:amino acid permease
VIGTIESLEYILYVVATVLILGQHITKFTSLSASFEPLWWLLFFLLSFLYNISSSRLFWSMNILLSLLCLLVVLIYSFGLFSKINFYENISNEKTEIFEGGFVSFLYQLPLAAWWYIGVECIILLANDLHEVSVLFLFPSLRL